MNLLLLKTLAPAVLLIPLAYYAGTLNGRSQEKESQAFEAIKQTIERQRFITDIADLRERLKHEQENVNIQFKDRVRILYKDRVADVNCAVPDGAVGLLNEAIAQASSANSAKLEGSLQNTEPTTAVD